MSDNLSKPRYTCRECGGPAFGCFCSVRCWRLDRGLSDIEEASAYSAEAIAAHASAPKIFAERRLPGAGASFKQPPPTDSAGPTCIACGDTGRNSKGGDCVPCVRHGRAKPQRSRMAASAPAVGVSETSKGSDDFPGPSWQDAETEVLRWGIVEHRETVAAARARGVTPVYVLACVHFYRDHRRQFKPSDLRKRLSNAAACHDPDDMATWAK